jgi:hypothetical protein
MSTFPLNSQGLLEYDDEPWAAKTTLVAKPYHEEVNFKYYIWRMAINNRRINQFSKPFRHPIRRCNNAVQDLGDTWFY